MKYKITIETVEPSQEPRYPIKTTLYDQEFEDLDIRAIIGIANRLLIPKNPLDESPYPPLNQK